MCPDLNATAAREPPDDAERLLERRANSGCSDALERDDERSRSHDPYQLDARRRRTRERRSSNPIEHLGAATQRAAAEVLSRKMICNTFIEQR